jgi:hypothetical protein
MALGTELFTLATSYDPYGAFKEGMRAPAQQEIQDIATQQQLQEARAEQAQSLAQMTGQVGAKPPLSDMTKSVFPPNVKLQTDDGSLTVAGEVSQNLSPYLNAKSSAEKQLADSSKIRKLATYEQDPNKRTQMLRNAAEIESKARLEEREASNQSKKVVDEFYGNLATRYVNAMNAPSQKEYDSELDSWNKKSGFPPFKDAPEKYGPETREKLKEYMKTLPGPLQEKIKEKLKAERKEKDAEIKSTLEIDQLLAKQRNGWRPLKGEEGGVKTTSKVYETLEEKVNDPNYGVAKGKVPSKEQTVARRITTDSKEVTQGIDQVMTLTEGGMRNTTGTTFANVKDTGLLTAPAKFFTNKISNQDSAMYDAMMYPLVKGLSLYTNPDYRPTDNDVKIAMNAYKAQAGQPQAVQLEKMAELKKNYLSAAESFLDSSILNPQQANSLKQQIKYVEKAIPWDVNDVVNFTRQKEDKDFKQYLSKKGKQVVDPTKSSETSKPQTVSVGNQTYTRPAGMSDKDWADYKVAVGAN